MEAAVSYLQSRGKRVTGLLGHSKGGTEVILYAARHDADGSKMRIVNVCGRCHLKQGIERRFDAATLARLEQEGSLQLPHPKTGQPFTLTSQVHAVEQLQPFAAIMGCRWSHADHRFHNAVSRIQPHASQASPLASLHTQGPRLPHMQEMQERMTTDMVDEAKKIRNTEVLTIHGSADDTIPLADAEEFDRHISHHTLKIVDGADHRFSQHKDAFVPLAAEFLLGR